MEIIAKLEAMEDRAGVIMLLLRWRNSITSQPRLLNFITRRFQFFLPDMVDMLLLRPNRLPAISPSFPFPTISSISGLLWRSSFVCWRLLEIPAVLSANN
jgi:hypothetical protein